MDFPFFEPYLRRADLVESHLKPTRKETLSSKPYVRTSPRPGTEEFKARLRLLNGLPFTNQHGPGEVLAIDQSRKWNEGQARIRAREIEAENRRKEDEESRIRWTE
jgi:hypothetical protein